MRTAFFLAGAVVAGCAGFGDPEPPSQPPAETTFRRLYRSAELGDPQSQNAVGFLLFYGEVAPMSRPIAQHWFQSAAVQGDVSAQLNLAITRYLGAGVAADSAEAERLFRQARQMSEYAPRTLRRDDIPDTLEALIGQVCAQSDPQVTVGERAFVTYCAGCHGLNGLAAYPGAPSFALGERMEKSDAELLAVILRGHEGMPGWSDKLSTEALTGAMQFTRTLESDFRRGVLHRLREPPGYYFLFGSMAWDEAAYRTTGVTEYERNFDSLDRLCP